MSIRSSCLFVSTTPEIEVHSSAKRMYWFARRDRSRFFFVFRGNEIFLRFRALGARGRFLMVVPSRFCALERLADGVELLMLPSTTASFGIARC